MCSPNESRDFDDSKLKNELVQVESHPLHDEESIDFREDDNILERRQIGLFSAVFIIFNRIIGTGVFATPSSILTLSGSVGLSLFMWVIGAIIAGAGMQVYIVWGSVGPFVFIQILYCISYILCIQALPKNGGEKNYLEYLFRKPKFLITSVFSVNAVLLAWAAGNSLVFGEYILLAANIEPTRWTLRLVGFACITFSFLIHGTALKWGLRLQNFLGVFKILVLVFIIITGFVALGGHMKIPEPHNFTNAFEGTTASASTFCLSLYNVIWSYIGFGNANYALSEVKNPQRTVRIAGPLAIAIVTVLYMLANIAYFAGATKEEITSSGRLVAALLFKNRLDWIICLIVIFALPPGDAYNFVINVISYPLSIINALISFGLIYLAFRPYPDWPLSSVSSLIATAFFGAVNVFLFIVPLLRPPPIAEPYVSLPYWTHAVAGWAVFGLGLIYYLIWAKLVPWIGGYKLVRVEEVGHDGLRRHVFKTVKEG